MKECKVVLLSLEDAREALIKFYTDMLVEDKKHTEELIRDGNLSNIPNLMAMSPKDIAQKYRELDLAYYIFNERDDVHAVVIELSDQWWQFVKAR